MVTRFFGSEKKVVHWGIVARIVDFNWKNDNYTPMNVFFFRAKKRVTIGIGVLLQVCDGREPNCFEHNRVGALQLCVVSGIGYRCC